MVVRFIFVFYVCASADLLLIFDIHIFFVQNGSAFFMVYHECEKALVGKASTADKSFNNPWTLL